MTLCHIHSLKLLNLIKLQLSCFNKDMKLTHIKQHNILIITSLQLLLCHLSISSFNFILCCSVLSPCLIKKISLCYCSQSSVISYHLSVPIYSTLQKYSPHSTFPHFAVLQPGIQISFNYLYFNLIGLYTI